MLLSDFTLSKFTKDILHLLKLVFKHFISNADFDTNFYRAEQRTEVWKIEVVTVNTM